MLLDHPLLSERYFFPRPERPRPSWNVTTRDGENLVCLRADGGHPRTLVLYHGNGEVPADYESWIKPMAELGCNLVAVPFRGYGGSTGVPQLGKMLDDVDAVFEALGESARQLVVFGRSLGSLYATEFVSRHPEVPALVLESGISDPLERVLVRATPEELGTTMEQLRAEVSEHFDQERKLRGYGGQTLLLHTLHDGLVEATHARRNAAACRNGKLVLFERGNHNTILSDNAPAYFRELTELLRSVG